MALLDWVTLLDVVFVSFPFTDLSSSKRRPALVVSPDSFNQTMQDVVLAAITTQGAEDSPFTIDQDDCIEGTLPKRSVVKPAKLFTMALDARPQENLRAPP